MGLLGTYVIVDNLLLGQIISGDKDIFEIDPTACKILGNIDKSWQAIQYLLCKDIDNGEPPMCYVVPIRDENELDCGDVCDISAFYITAEQVKEASGYLNALDDKTLKNMYDFKLMKENKVYPLNGNENENEAESFYEYIYSHLAMLKIYFKETAEKGYAIIFYVV